jgi:hypothetical protein
MRENKDIYADLEMISEEFERDRIASLSMAEREQLNAYETGPEVCVLTLVDLGRRLLDSEVSGKLSETYYKD